MGLNTGMKLKSGSVLFPGAYLPHKILLRSYCLTYHACREFETDKDNSYLKSVLGLLLKEI